MCTSVLAAKSIQTSPTSNLIRCFFKGSYIAVDAFFGISRIAFYHQETIRWTRHRGWRLANLAKAPIGSEVVRSSSPTKSTNLKKTAAGIWPSKVLSTG